MPTAEPSSTITAEGDCDGRFEAVRHAFLANFDRAGDVGASVAVAVGGEVVVDLWGGHLDEARTEPWQRDTLVNVFSTTKTMSCLALLVCADRGLIDVDAPVATYWPEFAAAGKEGVLVRHLLSHTAGLSGWDERLAPEDLYDWEKCTSLLAAQAPWWEPGTRSGYHAVTQGYLVGEVVRRVTGSTVGRFFADEIAGPLDADVHIGLDPSEDHRVAPLLPVPSLAEQSVAAGPVERDSVAFRTFVNPRLEAPQSFDAAWRRAEIPAAGGQGNARGVLRAQHAVANGGEFAGVRLLSGATLDRILDVQAAGRDLVLGIGVTFGIGYGLNSPRAPMSPSPRVCYWGGWGGSLVVNDMDTSMTMAYVMNRMGPGTVGDDRAHTILDAVYASLGVDWERPGVVG
ncbi:MAG: serine hydrolase domain-containing protein [Acidimicrobiales bacterium]